MKRVEVEWIDSGVQSVNGWQTREQHVKEAVITTARSCGYVMAEDEDTLWLAQCVDPDNDMYYNVSGIWRPSIRKMKVLRER